MINTIDADKLSTQGPRASAAFVLTYFSRNSQLQHQESYTYMFLNYKRDFV